MAVRFESQSEPIAGYRLLDRLGSGGFGEVWRCEAPGGIFKAVKIIHGDLRNRETDTYRFAEQELKSLHRVKSVRHPYLLALDRFDVVDGRLMIVMELADRNLWDRFRECRRQGLPGIPRAELLGYMAEAAEVLDLFNDEFQLQHLDVKPQNLFLLYGHVKVADFGQVKDLEGLMAQVTGGITPVYAAPETFDGFVSRYCDQYSLACVYQELLTGVRPFDGGSMQQLLMQHLQMPPNLTPSPASDRPALLKALAKRPEDRFASVTAMVAALRGGTGTPPPPSTAATLTGLGPPVPDLVVPAARGPVFAPPLPQGSGGVAAPDSTPPPRAVTDTMPPAIPAPPEATGPGPLRPALVIGLGYTGLRVLQRFRKLVADRSGPPDKTPLVRTLYVDTDPDALAAAVADQPWAGLVGLRPDDVIPAKLNRPAHYLKPRLSGRTLTEGWFDPQLLYRLPRTPVTMGYRAFGRLAFCDHYRTIAQRVQAELAACLGPAALAATEAATGLAPRTNRPRVYVVAGLGGGTGGGMFLDLAYAVRCQLRALGHANPDVVGVLLLPPDSPAGEVGPLAQANTYAALTELHHYSHDSTVYLACYDGGDGVIRDTGPPFTQVVMVPGLSHPPPPSSGSGSSLVPPGSRNSGVVPATVRSSGTLPTVPPRGTGTVRVPVDRRTGTWGPEFVRRQPDLDAPDRDPSAAAAEFLRLDLFSPIGRAADDLRPRPAPQAFGAHVRAVGVAKFAWPRAEVVARAARVIAPVLMSHWVAPDPTHVRQVIPGWAADLWARVGLDPDNLTARLVAAADRAFGGKVEDEFAAVADALVPKGWLARLPDPDAVARTLTRWQEMLGRPQGAVLRSPLPIEKALKAAGGDAASSARTEFARLFPGLVETPQFRLAGTEEALRQLLALLDRTKEKFEQQAAELEAIAAAAFDQLVTHTNFQKGIRKLTAAEFTDAVRQFPMARYQTLLKQAAVAVYRSCRAFLTDRLADVAACRTRLELYRPMLKAEADVPAPPAVPGDLLPPGCSSPESAAKAFLRSLTDDDLTDLDERIQAALEQAYGGLYQACLSSTDGPDGLLRLLREETRAYLDVRLGEVDLQGMLAKHLGTGEAAALGVQQAFDKAAPGLVSGGPWSQAGIAVMAGPAGAGGDPVRDLAAPVLPPGTATVELADELVLYREYPEVPLAAVPQLGPVWVAAYKAAPDVHQVTPHARTDVTRWIDVDAE